MFPLLGHEHLLGFSVSFVQTTVTEDALQAACARGSLAGKSIPSSPITADFVGGGRPFQI